MALVPVKDPKVLAELEGGAKPVTDPAILAQLEGGGSLSANLAKIDAQRQSEAFEEPETFAYLFNRIKKGFAGFMGLPGDVVKSLRDRPSAMVPWLGASPLAPFADMAMKSVAPSEETIPTERLIATSKTYRDAMGFDPTMRTHSDVKRYAGGVAEMGAAGGPFGLATKPATLLPLATGITGSGFGMELGGDVASGLGLSRDAGEAVGAIAGGSFSAVAPNAAVAAAGAIRRRFSPSAQKATAEGAAGREITEQLESYPPAQENIKRSLEISDEIPGFNPSLPARSGAPGLIAEEKVLISQNPKTLNKAVERIEENNKAIEDYLNAKFPKAEGETSASRVRRLGQMHADRLDGIRTQIDEKLDDAVGVFESNPSNYENGKRLRELFFKQKEVYAGTRSQKYTEVYEAADKAGLKANLDDSVQYVRDVLKNEMNAYQQAEIPSSFRQLKADFVKEPSTDGPTVKTTPTGKKIKLYGTSEPTVEKADVSFKYLHSLYKRVNSDLASLRGSNRSDVDFQIKLLGDLKTKLTDKIRGFEDAGFGEVAAKLKEANRFYAEEYLPRFKQGFGSDVVARYPSGEFRTPDQLVTELITKRPNNTQAAKDFKLLFDEVPEAQKALRDGYLDEFYRSGGAIDKNGRINQRALDTFLRRHEPTLTEYPQIKGELRNLALDNSALLERRSAIVAAEKKLAASDLYQLFQGRDPNIILAEATTNKNAMRVLSYQARNDPNMAKGLARGIAEHVTQQPDPAAFLAANEEAIRIGLKPMGEDHFRNLKTAVEAMTINDRNPAAMSVQAASVTPDTFAAKVGSSPRAIISHILNAERGRTGYTQEGAAFLGRWFDKLRREHKAVAMEAVFYDKDVARALSNIAKNPASEKGKLEFAAQLVSLGVRAEVAGQ